MRGGEGAGPLMVVPDGAGGARQGQGPGHRGTGTGAQGCWYAHTPGHCDGSLVWVPRNIAMMQVAWLVHAVLVGRCSSLGVVRPRIAGWQFPKPGHECS